MYVTPNSRLRGVGDFDGAWDIPAPIYWIEGALSTILISWPAFANEMETVRPARPHPMTMIR